MKNKKNIKLKRILAALLVTSFVMTGCNKAEPEPAEIITVATTVTEETTTEEPVITREPPVVLEKFDEWLDINEDVIGYIKIGDTRVNYPVLQGDDNDYYMDYTITGEPSWSEACITADFRGKFDGWDYPTNTILIGHNSMKGTYFASLSNYYRSAVDGSASYYKKYPIVNFDTLYEEMEWKVFACVLFNTQEKFGDVIRYWDYGEFKGEDEFNNFILDIMDRSVLFTDVDLEYGDKLLTLSTCYYPYGKEVDSRVVVFARKVREGETSEVDTSKAYYNRQALRFKEEERRIGSMYPGHRVWDTSYLKSYDEKKASKTDIADKTDKTDE